MSETLSEDVDRLEGSEIDAALDELETSQSEAAFGSAEEKRASSGSKATPDLTSLIASKISELEKETNKDEEEEKEIARAVKAEHRKLSTLVSETDTEIGKVTLLQRKYTTLFQDMQRLEREHARQRAKSEKFNKEFSTTKVELNKAVSMKHKLETLCRELQKENKRVKEDSKRLAQSEQQKRVELNNKFETTIFEIKTKMDEDSGLVGKRRLEDSELKDKFKSFLEQYESREKHFHSTLRVKELEVQLSQARLEQFKKASDSNELRAKTLHSQVSTFSETESELRSQLNIYVDKFKQVEDTLNNSNDLFLNFRKEMESMTKKTKKLEKENALIRSKCDTANKSILEMAEERAKYRKEIESLKQKSSKLENLCRALQRERANSAVKAPAVPHGTHQNGNVEKSSSGASIDTEARSAQLRQDEPSDGSLEDDYSEASFELETADSSAIVPPEQALSNQIAGFLKVSAAEEEIIREKRRDYGQNTHCSPDRDPDGYLAVSHLEKEFISAVRDSKLYNNETSPTGALSSAADMDEKLHELQKALRESMPQLRQTVKSGKENRKPLSEPEKLLYTQAASRLARITQPFIKGASGLKRLDPQSLLPQLGADTASMTGDRHELLLDVFQEQLTNEKIDDFSKHFADMLDICQNSRSRPPSRDIYDALMTAAAILLPDEEIADLKVLHEQVKQSA